MFIHSFTMLMILAWFFALGSLKFPHWLYENGYTYYVQPYNSFRIKCNAVNDFRKAGFNFQSELDGFVQKHSGQRFGLDEYPL